MLDEKTVRAAKKCCERSLLAIKNVVGVGVGYKKIRGVTTDELCIVVSVAEKPPIYRVASSDQIPARVAGGVSTDVQKTGVFRALRTGKHRPAPGGVSVGHPAVTAGTLGCLVRKSGEIFILSNNHVLADSNRGRKGDPIVQPGAYDGGTVDADQIATLEEFVEVKFLLDGLPDCPTAIVVQDVLNWLARQAGSAHRFKAYQENDPLPTNLVDAAIAKPLSNDLVTEEILEIGVPKGTVIGELGMVVQKSGRTTGLTQGLINQIDLTVQVQYGGSDIALFTDQLQADLPCGGGDSGSVVLSGDHLVGLLFAGSEDGAIMIANRFENVVAELELDR